MRPLYRLWYHTLTIKWKIHTLNWARTRSPIPLWRLAHEVARKVNRYLIHMAVRSYSHEPSAVAHKHTENYPGWVSRRSLEDRPRFHAHRQHVSCQSHVSFERVFPTRDLCRGSCRAACTHGPVELICSLTCSWFERKISSTCPYLLSHVSVYSFTFVRLGLNICHRCERWNPTNHDTCPTNLMFLWNPYILAADMRFYGSRR